MSADKLDSNHSENPKLLPSAFYGLVLLESAVIFGVVAHYKVAGRVDGDSPGTLDFAMLVLAVVLVIGGAMLLGRAYRSPMRQSFWLSSALNIVTLVLVLGLSEVVLRVLVATNPAVTSLLPRGLLPRDWSDVAQRNQALLDEDRGYASFLVSDDRIGWSVGSSRKSPDDLYVSSPEGIRSPNSATTYAENRGKRRIALVGDSYTFSEAVSFEDSWGYHLNQNLGDAFDVLNFGVPGYGVDQAYLRYEVHAAEFNPEVVILSLINHDLYRSLTVYTPIAFPSWQMPFANPRFVVQEGTLELRNSPVPTPASVFATPQAIDLPNVDLEPQFLDSDWRWRWYHSLYTFRFALSVIPNYPVKDQLLMGDAVVVNTEILRAFHRSARARGIEPVIAYLPSTQSGELASGAGDVRPAAASAVINNLGIPVFDATSCMRQVEPEQVKASDGIHYSGHANRALAGCVADYLDDQGLLALQ